MRKVFIPRVFSWSIIDNECAQQICCIFLRKCAQKLQELHLSLKTAWYCEPYLLLLHWICEFCDFWSFGFASFGRKKNSRKNIYYHTFIKKAFVTKALSSAGCKNSKKFWRVYSHSYSILRKLFPFIILYQGRAYRRGSIPNGGGVFWHPPDRNIFSEKISISDHFRPQKIWHPKNEELR